MRQPLPGIEVTDVAAGDERALARAGHNDHPHGVIPVDLVERSFEPEQRRAVESIQRLRPVDGEKRRALTAFDQNGFIAHHGFSYSRTRRTAAITFSAFGR
jgi:hypothetical protein